LREIFRKIALKNGCNVEIGNTKKIKKRKRENADCQKSDKKDGANDKFCRNIYS